MSQPDSFAHTGASASATSGSSLNRSVDPAEIERFSRIADEWWDPNGKFRPLHKFNPTRLAWLIGQIRAHFQRVDVKDGANDGAKDGDNWTEVRPLEGLRLLDIGCGGGLIAEPMARLGAQVVAIDAAERNIMTARTHADRMGLTIDYRHTTAEALLAAGERFDIVLTLEVVEHVADPDAFLHTCVGLVRPGGALAAATLNRTAKSFLLAIVGAEYVLRWLPRGTHSWKKFVKPSELVTALRRAGLTVTASTGLTYNPLADSWRTSRDLEVNYMLFGTRGA